MSTSYHYVIKVPFYSSQPNMTNEPSFRDILIGVVCRHLDIDSKELYNKNRTSRIKYGRWMVWEIIIATKGFKITDCAKIFGDYDHTTVVHALDTLPLDLAQNELLNAIYKGVLDHLGIKFETIEKFRAFRIKNKTDRKLRLPKIHA